MRGQTGNKVSIWPVQLQVGRKKIYFAVLCVKDEKFVIVLITSFNCQLIREFARSINCHEIVQTSPCLQEPRWWLGLSCLRKQNSKSLQWKGQKRRIVDSFSWKIVIVIVNDFFLMLISKENLNIISYMAGVSNLNELWTAAGSVISFSLLKMLRFFGFFKCQKLYNKTKLQMWTQFLFLTLN